MNEEACSAALFANASALIFGGAKGIGRAIAFEWARRGCQIAVADIDDAAAEALAGEIEAAGGVAIGIGADVLSAASMEAAVRAAEDRFGQIGIVMNNVGAILNGHPEDVPMAEWQRIMELNYFAVVRSNAIFLPKMLKRGRGHIVNTASFSGLYPYAASRIAYAAAKAAVISLSENLAIYLEPQGIRVSCLIPGPVATGVMESMSIWTPGAELRGPGAETTLMLPEDVAARLADGMEAGQILIPSDDVAWDIVKRYAASPDEFIRAKIKEFDRGNFGKPAVPEEILRAMSQGQ